MDPLIDLINLLNWPLALILNRFSSCKIALLRCSFRGKPSSELAQLFILMLSDCHKSIIAIEHNRQAVDIPKVAVILEARKGLDRIIVAGKRARKLDKRKVMFRDIYLQELDELHQRTMVGQLPRPDDLPRFIALPKHTSEPMTLEDEQASVAWHSEHIFR